MSQARRKRKFSSRAIMLAGFAIAILVLILLILYARLTVQNSDAPEIRAILKEIEAEIIAAARAERQARDALPPDAPIPRHWHFLTADAPWQNNEQHALLALSSSVVHDPGELSETALEDLRQKLGNRPTSQKKTALENSLDPSAHSPQEILTAFRDLVLKSKVLDDLEAAVDLGLFIRPELYPDVMLREGYLPVNLLAGRAIFLAQAKDMDKAVATWLRVARMAAVVSDPYATFYIGKRDAPTRAADYALWLVVDAAPLAESARQTIQTQLDARASTDALAKAIRFRSAEAESGHNMPFGPRKEGNPAFRFSASRSGRDSFQQGKTLIEILNQPPYQVQDKLRPPGEDFSRERHGHGMHFQARRFARSASDAIRHHARYAFTAETFRLALALKAYKAGHGAYPATLDALEPAPALIDPVTGEAVKYEASGDGFTLTVTTGPSDKPSEDTLWRARQ